MNFSTALHHLAILIIFDIGILYRNSIDIKTYQTKYKGSVSDSFSVIDDPNAKINIEKLKLREAIHYYRDIRFLDDELDDNGASSTGLKIRVMPSCFFILLRHYLRVDKGNFLIKCLNWLKNIQG